MTSTLATQKRTYRYNLTPSNRLTAARVCANERSYNGNNNSSKLMNTIGYFAALPGLPPLVGAIGLSMSTLSYIGSQFTSRRNLETFCRDIDSKFGGNNVVLEITELYTSDDIHGMGSKDWRVRFNFPTDIKAANANPRVAFVGSSSACANYIRGK